jgi:hypothetical protein
LFFYTEVILRLWDGFSIEVELEIASTNEAKDMARRFCSFHGELSFKVSSNFNLATANLDG